MADLAMAVVSVSSAFVRRSISSGEIRWTRPSGFNGFLTYRRFSLNAHNFFDETLFVPTSSNGHRRHHRC